VDGACERWKPNREVLRAVIQYVKDTKRFQPKATMEEPGVAEEAGEAEGVGAAEGRSSRGSSSSGGSGSN
jgi:hypothetical protein